MDLLIFLSLIVPIFLLFIFQKHKTIRRNVHHLPPGPKGLPFIGNLLQLDNSTLHHYLWRLSQKYGPLMSLRLGFRQVLVVSSAKMAKEVLKTHDLIFCSRPSFLGMRKLSYNRSDIAFSPYNIYWREMRRISVIHLFSSNKANSFQSVREHEVSSMIRKVTELAANNASKPVNLSEQMMSLTSSVICRIGFGMRGELETSRFHELTVETEALFTTFFVSDYFHGFGFIDKLTGLIRRLEKNFQDSDRFYEQIIKEHLDPNRPKPEQDDILDVLLRIWKDPNSFKIQLTLDNIKAVLMNVFVAGTDTSAAVVVWAMTLLMKNPEAMKKTREEVRNVGRNKGFIDEDDVQQLLYLKAVIKETMRLQPPAPLLLPRELSENCKLDGYDIAAKTIVYVNAYAIGRDPEVWQNPEEFRPERFIGNSIDLKGQDYELIPFGAGRRICPGMHLGLATVELSLANLLYKFNWEMPEGTRSEDIDMDVKPGVTMHKKNALCLMASTCEPYSSAN